MCCHTPLAGLLHAGSPLSLTVSLSHGRFVGKVTSTSLPTYNPSSSVTTSPAQSVVQSTRNATPPPLSHPLNDNDCGGGDSCVSPAAAPAPLAAVAAGFGAISKQRVECMLDCSSKLRCVVALLSDEPEPALHRIH